MRMSRLIVGRLRVEQLHDELGAFVGLLGFLLVFLGLVLLAVHHHQQLALQRLVRLQRPSGDATAARSAETRPGSAHSSGSPPSAPRSSRSACRFPRFQRLDLHFHLLHLILARTAGCSLGVVAVAQLGTIAATILGRIGRGRIYGSNCRRRTDTEILEFQRKVFVGHVGEPPRETTSSTMNYGGFAKLRYTGLYCIYTVVLHKNYCNLHAINC